MGALSAVRGRPWIDRGSLTNPTVLLGLTLFVCLFLQSWSTGRTQPQDDFWNIWAIGRLTATTSDIYSDAAQTTLAAKLQLDVKSSGASAREVRAASYWQTLQSNCTPALYAIMGYLQTGDFELDSGIFEALSLLAILAAVFWLCRRLGFPPGGALLVAAVILGANSAMYLDLWVGNFNALQVGILVAYLALRGGPSTVPRGVLGGLLLGAAVVMKPNLGLVVVLLGMTLLVERRWRDAAAQTGGLALGALVAVGVSVVRFGSLAPWGAWLNQWRDAGFRDYFRMDWGNFSLVRWIWETTGANVAVLSLILFVGLVLGAYLWGRWHANPDSPVPGPVSEEHRWGIETLLLAAAVEVTLLASPLSHQHYYLLLVPATVFLLRPAGERFGGSPNVVFRQVAAVVAMILVSSWPVQAIWPSGNPVAYLFSYVSAAALLLAAGLWELACDRPPLPVEVVAADAVVGQRLRDLTSDPLSPSPQGAS